MFRILKKIFGALVMTGLTLTILWAIGLIWYGTIIATASPQDQTRKTDALIVATGGQNRIVEGLRLLQDDKADKLFISGVNKGVQVETLTGPNPPCCITLGYEAQDTRGNALESLAWVKQNNIMSLRLITSDYHMPRAYLEFRHHLAPEIDILKYPVRDTRHDIVSEPFLLLVFEEYHKYLATWMRLHVMPPQSKIEEGA